MWKTTQWTSNVSSILRTASPYVGSKTVLDSGFQVLDCRFQSMDSGFQVLHSRFQSVDPGFQLLDPLALLVSTNAVELRFRIPSRRKLVSGLQSLEGVRIPWDELRIQSHDFRIPQTKFPAFRNPDYLQRSKWGEMEQSHVSLFLTWYLVEKKWNWGYFPSIWQY